MAVAVAHLWLVARVLPTQLGEGAAEVSPRRMQVSFVHQLAPAAPPPAAVQRPRVRRLAAMASAPAAREEPPLPLLATAEALPEDTLAPLPSLPELPEVATTNAAFAWPPSTRLSYRLSGNYRGPVEGQARVEWLRSGTRYQVFMDLAIGPSFAPLVSRRVSSEGSITAEGLSPRRYDELTQALLHDARQLTIFLDADRVRLPGGREWPRPAGVQDSASQFVQLTWLFTTQPQWLEAGRAIELPLALPRRVETWIYDVLGAEVLDTPAGAVPAVHVKPRREARPGGDLTAEIWVAPSLQYLPVRILIRQDAETYVDLLIEQLPEQAEREPEHAPARAPEGPASAPYSDANTSRRPP